MEPDPARSHYPDTNVGKQAYFVTTLVNGSARNYGESADEKKGKRIHFRTSNGVLYEFRNSQGFVQYTCVDCEKQSAKKYTLIYVDQDGRYTREPEQAIHSCSGHMASDAAAPSKEGESAVRQVSSTSTAHCAEHACRRPFTSVIQQSAERRQLIGPTSTVPSTVSVSNMIVGASAIGTLQQTSLLPAGLQSALDRAVQPGSTMRVESSLNDQPFHRRATPDLVGGSAADVDQVPLAAGISSKAATISQLQQLIQGQPAEAQVTLPVSFLRSVLNEVMQSGTPTSRATTVPINPAASASLCVPPYSGASLLMASRTPYDPRRVLPGSACAPSMSSQVCSLSTSGLGPQARAEWTVPSMNKRTDFKKALARKIKSKQEKPHAAKKRRTKVDEYNQLKTELAQLKRNQEEILAHVQAMKNSQKNTTGACVNNHIGLSDSSFPGHPQGQYAVDQGARTSSATGSLCQHFMPITAEHPENIATPSFPQQGPSSSNNETDAPVTSLSVPDLEVLSPGTLDELLKTLRRPGGAPASLVPERLSRAQTRYKQPNRITVMRRSASEGDKQFLTTNKRFPSNGNTASDETAGKRSSDRDSGQKRDLNRLSTDRMYSVLTHRTGSVLTTSHSAGDLSTIFRAEVRLSASETEDEKQDDSRARRDSASSVGSIPSGLFLSRLTISSVPDTLEPSVGATDLPTSDETNGFKEHRGIPSEIECSNSCYADNDTQSLKHQSITESAPTSVRHNTESSSKQPILGSSRPSPTAPEEADIISDIDRDAARYSKAYPPRQALSSEAVINLLEATVKKIICSEVHMYSPDRSKLDRTIHAWHELGAVARTIYDHDREGSDPEYTEKELAFISSHLTELVHAAALARRRAVAVCHDTFIHYICAVVYAWYISYDFDAVPWIRKMFCMAEQFSTFRQFLRDEVGEFGVSRSLILPGLTSEAHIFRRLFGYAMPAGSIKLFELGLSEQDSWEKTSHFENMRKLYNILWSDKLISQEWFPAFHPFVKLCIDQDRRHGSKLLGRMVLRRAISAVAQPESDEVRIRTLVVLRRVLIDNDCDQVDVSGFDLTHYAEIFGNSQVVEILRRISSEQDPQQISSMLVAGRRLPRGTQPCSVYPHMQYGDRITGHLWDSIEPELQRPFELSVIKPSIDPGFVEFMDWRFEHRLIVQLLREDLRYLSKPLFPESNKVRASRGVLLKINAKPFHLVLDLGNMTGNEDDVFWHNDSEVIAKFHSGRLVLYFTDIDHSEHVENLFLLDYTLSFGSRDRPGPTLRFLRITEMGPSMSKGILESNIQRIEENTGIQHGLARSRTVPQMRVLSIDKLMKFRPYLEVRGTAIPIYSPLKGLSKLLEGVHGKSNAFPPNLIPMEKLDLALNVMTANGWRDHIEANNDASSVHEKKALDVSQRKPMANDTGAIKHLWRAQANDGDKRRLSRFLSRFRRSEVSTHDNDARTSGEGKIAPDLNDVD